MRISLIFIILCYSVTFGQSTIFVKYKSNFETVSDNSIILKKINQSIIDNESSLNKRTFQVSSFSHIYKNLNTSLRQLYKIETTDYNFAEEIINSLKNDIDVEYVQLAQTYNIDYLPIDSLYSEQWGLKSINAEEAWDLIPENSNEIILAVIDTGIDFEHPDIDGALYNNSGEIGIDINGVDKSNNGIDDDENGFIDDFQGWDFVNKRNIYPADIKDDFTDWDNIPMDEHGHGTNVAGIIGAEHNRIGIAGVNPNVKILNLRAFDKNGNGEEDDAASAIIYAVNMGAKIINMSWGDSQYSKVLKDVIEYAYENGVILIGSSGNSGSDLPHFPSGFSEVVSVGAIQENEALASFSNYGSTVDLVAPGSQIITLNLDNSYKSVSGTSAATPYVSAAASIIKSIKDFSNEEVKQILKSTARDLGNAGWDDSYGAGNLNLAKALSILSPSIVGINSPKQDLYTDSDSLIVNISCLSPYFQNYKLYYGVGLNPQDWTYLQTEDEELQKKDEVVHKLNLFNLSDTSYTIRLLLNRIDGSTQEERSNFYIYRNTPEVLNYTLFPAMLNDVETVQSSIITDVPTTVELYYRNINSESDFNYISLDGFTSDIGMLSSIHFGFLPIDEVISGIDHEFYFRITSPTGTSNTYGIDENNNYLFAKQSIDQNILNSYQKNYSLPIGRIYKEPISLGTRTNSFILLNENETSADVGIYEFSDNTLTKKNVLENKIPISVSDFNNDGKTDFLNLFVKNGFIDSQINENDLEFENIFRDTSQTFWPSYADDIDSDGNYEAIVFSSDTTITIWEIDSQLNLSKEFTLRNFVPNTSNMKSIFRNNIIIVNNFDEDNLDEIVAIDNYGRLLVYQINGNASYTEDKIIEHFSPLETNTTIADGDFNGDGKSDIGIVMEFEENVFQTPLTYSSVISITPDSIDYLFQNMFISTESNFIGSFEKQYRALAFEDVNQNGTDDLIIFTHPNSYIFEYDEAKTNLLFYQEGVNSQSIFIGDLDNNGINEIGIPNNEKLYFQEFINDGKISPPIISDYYSVDSNKVYLEWNTNENSVFIFKGSDKENLELFDSSNSNTYFDENVTNNNNYYYQLQYFNADSIISNKSDIIDIFVHATGSLSNLSVLSTQNIKMSFSQPIDVKNVRLSNFQITNDKIISSVIPENEKSIIINFENELKNGDYSLSISEMRDIYNAPIKDSVIVFEVNYDSISTNELFITNYNIIDNNSLEIIFNFNLDNLTSLNTSNYIFSPNNNIVEVSSYNLDKNKILIKTENPFGAIGKEYVLKISNIFSSIGSGSLSINETSGSEIVLTSNKENLDDIYVYPNPVNATTEYLTFANLPNRVDIHIFSIDGIFITKITEDDGNGGVDWNMTDDNGNKISSGIYFYKAIALDNFDNKLHEKIGKFAIIK